MAQVQLEICDQGTLRIQIIHDIEIEWGRLASGSPLSTYSPMLDKVPDLQSPLLL